jgi:hypothetical protein
MKQVHLISILLIAFLSTFSHSYITDKSLRASLGNYFIDDDFYDERYGSILLPSFSVKFQFAPKMNSRITNFIEYNPKFYNGTPEFVSDGSSKLQMHLINFGGNFRIYNSALFEAHILTALSFVADITETVTSDNYSSSLNSDFGWFGFCLGILLEKPINPSLSIIFDAKYNFDFMSLADDYWEDFGIFDFGGFDVLIGIAYQFDLPLSDNIEEDDSSEEDEEEGEEGEFEIEIED